MRPIFLLKKKKKKKFSSKDLRLGERRHDSSSFHTNKCIYHLIFSSFPTSTQIILDFLPKMLEEYCLCVFV